MIPGVLAHTSPSHPPKVATQPAPAWGLAIPPRWSQHDKQQDTSSPSPLKQRVSHQGILGAKHPRTYPTYIGFSSSCLRTPQPAPTLDPVILLGWPQCRGVLDPLALHMLWLQLSHQSTSCAEHCAKPRPVPASAPARQASRNMRSIQDILLDEVSPSRLGE